MTRICMLPILPAVLALSLNGDTIELKTGERLDGTFRRADVSGVMIEVGGQPITLPLEKVAAIYFGAARQAAGGKPSTTSTQTGPAAEALDALRALRSVTESSISYRDYAPRVLDAKVKVDRYVSSAKPDEAQLKTPLNQASDATQLWSHISNAMLMYEEASRSWSDWLTADESLRKIEQPILGTLDQQLAKCWKFSSREITAAEQVLAKKK